MINFYGDMRLGILYLSSSKSSFLLTESDIKNLPQYKRAEKEYKEDFDSTVFGTLSKGSIGISQAKTKVLKSPFPTTSNYNGEKEEPPNYYEQYTQQYYYEPEEKDQTDSLVA